MKPGAIVLTGALLAVFAGAPAFAAQEPAKGQTKEISAQSRTRVIVTPRETYPGRTATRDCEAWLQPEHRPSGTVLTPQMRCRWR